MIINGSPIETFCVAGHLVVTRKCQRDLFTLCTGSLEQSGLVFPVNYPVAVSTGLEYGVWLAVNDRLSVSISFDLGLRLETARIGSLIL